MPEHVGGAPTAEKHSSDMTEEKKTLTLIPSDGLKEVAVDGMRYHGGIGGQTSSLVAALHCATKRLPYILFVSIDGEAAQG